MVKVTELPTLIRQFAAADVHHLIDTGKVALDILASQYGGAYAELPNSMPRIRWAIGGLAIQTTDGTRATASTAGGPLRFDELRAGYTGVEGAVAKIGNVECLFTIFRVSRILSRRVKVLGYGDVRYALLMEGEETNGTIEFA
ncbi:MAG: hypothetical protein Q9209_006464 [Squamulea sp. 1 TL-2023]